MQITDLFQSAKVGAVFLVIGLASGTYIGKKWQLGDDATAIANAAKPYTEAVQAGTAKAAEFNSSVANGVSANAKLSSDSAAKREVIVKTVTQIKTVSGTCAIPKSFSSTINSLLEVSDETKYFSTHSTDPFVGLQHSAEQGSGGNPGAKVDDGAQGTTDVLPSPSGAAQ